MVLLVRVLFEEVSCYKLLAQNRFHKKNHPFSKNPIVDRKPLHLTPCLHNQPYGFHGLEELLIFHLRRVTEECEEGICEVDSEVLIAYFFRSLGQKFAVFILS